GELLLFVRRSTDPYGCALGWQPAATEAGATGVFQDPCRRNTWSRDGTLLLGTTARRDLDRVEHWVNGDGSVVVQVDRIVRGAQRPGAWAERP
ncbi:MAG: hypothetical protein WD800_01440, partial [Dehalococcoidia bacterium]